MITYTALHPEPVFVERPSEQFPAPPYAFMHQPGIHQYPADHNVSFVYSRPRIAINGLVKPVLSNGAAEEIVLDSRFHVRLHLFREPLQFAAAVDRIVRKDQGRGHLVMAPSSPLSAAVGIRRFQREPFGTVRPVPAHEEAGIIPRECVQNQHRAARVRLIARHLVQVAEPMGDRRKVRTRLPPCPGRKEISVSGRVFPVGVFHLHAHGIDDLHHPVLRILIVRKHHLAVPALNAVRVGDRPSQLPLLRTLVAVRAPHEPEAGFVRDQRHHPGFGHRHHPGYRSLQRVHAFRRRLNRIDRAGRFRQDRSRPAQNKHAEDRQHQKAHPFHSTPSFLLCVLSGPAVRITGVRVHG